MSPLSAFADGWRRSLRAPVPIAGLAAIQLLVVSPVALDLLAADVSLIDASAMDPTPALISVITHYEALTYTGLMTFLLGGVLDRLARDRATASHGFFAACGVYFFRFLRLMALAVPIYAALFLWVYDALPEGELPSYLLLAPLVLLVHVLFDYAKVRMVVEDRRSAIGALAASFRFIKRHPAAAINLYVLNAALAAAVWAIASTFSTDLVSAVVGYVLVRTVLRFVFAASLIALFQSRLAHAGYTARPIPTWPDSPAAEAVRPH